MSEPFELLTKEDIIERLKAMVRPTTNERWRHSEPTLHKLAKYLGISRANLVRRIYTGPKDIGPARQRLFSKIFCMIDNGQLRWEPDPLDKRRSVAIVSEAATPTPLRYKAVMTANGPKLAPGRRAQPLRAMPQFGKLTKS